MPTWAKIALIAVAAIALAAFLVDQRNTRQRQQQALERQEELIAQQQAALDQQQAVIEKQLETVDSVIGEYEGHIEQQKAEQEMADVLRSRQMHFAYVASGLSLASNAKVYVAEHYMIEGRFPSSNEEVGLPSPESLGSQGVESVAITEGGVIRVTYGPETGVDGGVLQLSPAANTAAGRIEWACSTADYPDIAQALPTCRFVEWE